MLRKHQRQMTDAIDATVRGKRYARRILCHVTPGGGKSALPIIAGRLIPAGLADALCWVCPRTALQDQGERNFLDPYFRRELGHNLTIRTSTNDFNPCRGQHGFITTYQAASMDEKHTILRDFSSKRYILVLDEYHHCELGGVWHQAIQPLVDRAAFVVLMTGTLERGNGARIAWTNYRETPDGFVPAIADDPDTTIIRYGRREALAEGAILPLQFHLMDGSAEWQGRGGDYHHAQTLTREAYASQALYSALKTEFAEQLLSSSVAHWQAHKQINSRAKLLIVTADLEGAQAAMKALEGRVKAEIATSHDSPAAMASIKRFKGSQLDCLVTIAMAYEGLDVPAITHIACLTHIRSVPWIEQMLARSVRVDPLAGPYSAQRGYIFAPDDFLFRQVVEQIQAEQLPFVGEEKREGKKKEKREPSGEEPPITPLGSAVTGYREMDFGVHGIAPVPDPVQTVKERETELRLQIDRHVGQFAFRNYYMPQRINAEMKEYFGKPRDEMTLEELLKCWAYVQTAYPLNGGAPAVKYAGASKPRGQGRRVPTKARPVAPETLQFKLF